MNGHQCAQTPERNPPVDLSVLVVSWNTGAMLAECVQSLIRTLDGVAVEIIVVDNASVDGTATTAAAEFSDCAPVRFIANATNVGFAAANNQALRVATGPVIAVVNPDTVFAGPVLAQLAQYVRQHRDVGIATCALVGPDGRVQSIHRAFPTLANTFYVDTRPGRWVDKRLLGRRMYGRSRLLGRRWQGEVEIDQAAGALLVMRRDAIAAAGGLFDERLPLFFNDVDLCRRMRIAGLKVVACYDLEVMHHGGGSLNQLEPEELRRRHWEGLREYYRLHETVWRRTALAAMGPVRARR
jgi:GT2 family glycosyltransferase